MPPSTQRGTWDILFTREINDKEKEYIKSRPVGLLDLEQLNVESQLAVGRDAGHATRAVSEMGRDGQSSLATNGHTDNTDVPALDNLALTDLEGERLALFVGYTYMLA